MRFHILLKIVSLLGRLVERNAFTFITAFRAAIVTTIVLLNFSSVRAEHHSALGLSATMGSEFRLDWLHQVGAGVLLGPVLSKQTVTFDGVSFSGQGIGLQARRRLSENQMRTGWTLDGRFLFRRATIGSQGREGQFDFAELQGAVGYHYDFFSWIVGRVGLGFQWRGLSPEYWLVGTGGPLKVSLGSHAGIAPLLEIGLIKEF